MNKVKQKLNSIHNLDLSMAASELFTKHPSHLSQELLKPAHGFLEARTSCSYTLRLTLPVWAVFLSVSLVSFLMRLQSISVIAGCLSFNACKRIKKGISCFYFCPCATGDSTGERDLFC